MRAKVAAVQPPCIYYTGGKFFSLVNLFKSYPEVRTYTLVDNTIHLIDAEGSVVAIVRQ